MKTSFDEIKRMAFRALDAGGAPQGVDEESAYATAWLEASGLPGLWMLGDALENSAPADRKAVQEPSSADDCLTVDAQGTSSVFLGPGLIDLMIWLIDKHGDAARMKIARLGHPRFLLAFIGQARERGMQISLETTDNAQGPSMLISPQAPAERTGPNSHGGGSKATWRASMPMTMISRESMPTRARSSFRRPKRPGFLAQAPD